ncbi:hypothetical protein MCOR25_001430 [Pyricularia grisea]|nr:hypothetical protein MCOR25_001430 [Pyricularia grisea]
MEVDVAASIAANRRTETNASAPDAIADQPAGDESDEEDVKEEKDPKVAGGNTAHNADAANNELDMNLSGRDG